MIQKFFLSSKPVFFAGILLAFLAIGVSCSEETKCSIQILVTDTDNKPVAGADVKASSGPWEISGYKIEGKTDGSGIFKCEFDNPAVCEVTAALNGKTGQNAVITEPGETVNVTVVIY